MYFKSYVFLTMVKERIKKMQKKKGSFSIKFLLINEFQCVLSSFNIKLRSNSAYSFFGEDIFTGFNINDLLELSHERVQSKTIEEKK